MSSFTRSVFCLCAFLICLKQGDVFAEEAPSDHVVPASNIQFINATSVNAVDLTLKNIRDYRNLKQGTRISGGAFPFLAWGIRLSAVGNADSKLEAKADLTVQNLASITIVLVGDFVLVKDPGGKEILRAAIITLPNNLEPGQKANRLTIVNGLPTSAVRIEIEGQSSRTLEPMSVSGFDKLPASVTAIAKAENISISLPVDFVAPVRSVVIALYKRGEKIDFVAMSQLTFDDFDRR